MAFPRCFPGTVWMIVASAIPCLAQTTTTGLVEGQVRDASGRPLEGVQVRLVSSQVTRTAITNTEGRFHVGLLNPGEWAVTVAKAGYDTQTCRVSAVPEETASLRFKMALVASATVEVRGSSTTLSLDPTSTSAGMTVTRDDIERLPVGRNMNDLIYLAPTAGFAGSGWAGEGTQYSVSGASGIENQFVTDGLITTDLRFGGQGLFLVPEFVESVQVETSGFKPENSALGGVFNTVIRSGSNTFKGDAWVTFSPSNLEARAKFNAAGRQPAPADRFDFGFGAGGALVKDRLFYFAGVDLDSRKDRTDPNLSGLRGDDKDTGTTQAVLKMNGFLTPEQQLTATWITTRRKESQPRAYPDGYGDANMGYTRTFETRNISLVYDRSFASGLLLSLKAGSSWRKDEWVPGDISTPNIQDNHWFAGGGGGDQPDLAGYTYIRGGRGSYGYEQADTRQFKLDLTWLTGSHALKAGFSNMAATYGGRDFGTGPAGENWGYTINLDGTQIEASRFGRLQGTEVNARYQVFYVQDTWELDRSFRVIYGVRAERQEQQDAEGQTRLSFTDLGKYLQPRLGFTWDPNRDGRTLLTGSYAVYYEQIPQSLTFRAWGNETFNVLDYALDAYSPTGLGSFDRSSPTGGWNWEANTTQVVPRVRLPKRQEWSLGLEKTLPRGMTGSIHALYRRLTDGMDDSILYDREGNPVLRTAAGSIIGILWNPGPSVTFVAPAGAIDKDGNPVGGKTLTINDTFFPSAYNTYGALTLGLSQRTDLAFWSATYTWSHLWGNFEGLATSDRGAGAGTDANFGPGFDAWPYVGTGNLGLDRSHNFKLFGSRRFVFPSFAMNVGGRWTWQSGLALSLQDDGSTTMGLPPGTLGVGNPLDPLFAGALTYDHGLVGNHGRSPSVSVADLHVDLEFMAGKVRLMPTLDIYNVFNARTPTLIHQYATKWWSGEADPTYGLAQEWLQGRRIQVGLKARF